jgi:hypothetical protein
VIRLSQGHGPRLEPVELDAETADGTPLDKDKWDARAAWDPKQRTRDGALFACAAPPHLA